MKTQNRFQKKIWLWVSGFLRQGISPDKLALAVTFGICLGTIPLLGATTLLCALAAILFRLNMPAIQAVNYFVYPVQLLLYIPFLRIGAGLFNAGQFNYSLNQIVSMLSENMWPTICRFFWINLSGISLWLVVCSVIVLPVYYFCLNLFLKIAETMQKDMGIN